MLETGDFVDIRFGDEARNKKPVGIYWLQAASVRLGELVGVPDARRAIWLYRLPSLGGALATVILTYWAALALTSPTLALMAALLMAATVLLGVEARLATTDAVVAATVAGSMGALGRAYLGRGAATALRWRTCLIFWGAIGIGLLVKGPITPMVPLLAALVLSIRSRGWRWLLALRPLPGLLLCAAIVLPWFVLIIVRTHGAFLADSVGHDMIGKVAGGQERHGLPPGSYLLAVWLSGWPIAPFAALALPAVWRERRDDAMALLLAWLLPAWALFEAIPTKLFHYVLPLYPALAILAVVGLQRTLWRRSLPLSAIGLFFVLISVVPVALFGAMLVFQPLLWTIGPVTMTLGLAATLWALFWAWRAGLSLSMRSLPRAIIFAIVAAVPVYAFGFGWLARPSVSAPVAMSPRLVRAAAQALGPDCPEPHYATIGEREPSLMFLTGTHLLLTDPKTAARFLAEGSCRVAFVDQPAEAEFLETLGAEGAIHLAERVTGIALNGAKPLDIGVYVRQ